MVWAARTFFPGMALSSQAEGSVAWWRYYRITVYVVYTAVVARPGHSAPRARTLARPARSPPRPDARLATVTIMVATAAGRGGGNCLPSSRAGRGHMCHNSHFTCGTRDPGHRGPTLLTM